MPAWYFSGSDGLFSRLFVSSRFHVLLFYFLACLFALTHLYGDHRVPESLPDWLECPVLDHPAVDTNVGFPAYIDAGDSGHPLIYPTLKLHPPFAGTLRIKIYRSGISEAVFEDSVDIEFQQRGREVDLNDLNVPDLVPGNYRIELIMRKEEGNSSIYDALYFSVLDREQLDDRWSIAAHPAEDGALNYTKDYRGNRIPDFSTVGYKGGGVPLPEAPVAVVLEPSEGDDTTRIQDALEEVEGREKNSDGLRGAVLLKKGVYEISGSLRISRSGVVLRGEGQGDPAELWLDPEDGYSLEQLRERLAEAEATVLIATGDQRRRLIEIGGDGGISLQPEKESEILDQYVPVGAKSFRVEDLSAFEIGDQIVLERRGNSEWISAIGMDRIPSRPDGATTRQWEPFNLQFENTVVDIKDNRVHLQHAVVNAIERRWGGGRIIGYSDDDRIEQAALENLRAVSYWKPNEDGVDDTRHADRFLAMNNMKDGWVRNVTKEHFFSTSGAIQIQRGARSITIKDCSTLIADRAFYDGPGYDPSGRTFKETGVYVGRYGYHIGGQQNLVKGSYALNNRHAFVFGSRVPGPNAFVDCRADQSLTWSEPHHRWSVGGLYDNVEDMIALMNRLWYGTGHGWAGANYAAWNTRGELVCQQPPTAQNWAIGHVGRRSEGPFADHAEPGYWEHHGEHVYPPSLYRQQLGVRMND